MGPRRSRAPTVGREQVVFAHQAQHPHPPHADALSVAQAAVDGPVALAMERGGGQVSANQLEQRLVGHGGLGSALLRWTPRMRRLETLLTGVVGGASLLPGVTHPLHPVGFACSGGDRVAHFDDLLRAKGPDLLRTRFQSSSFSMVSSPRRFIAASSSALTGSFCRLLRLASIPSRARSRHCSRR